MKIYIYTTILIAIFFAVYILIDRKYKNSRPDTNLKIQRTLSSQIVGNLLQTDPNGNLSVAPNGLSLSGSILQSVSTKRSNGYRPFPNWMNVPDLSVSVTPISANVKFLLTANITFCQVDGGGNNGTTSTVFRFMRNNQPTGLGSGNVQNQIVGSFRASPSNGASQAWAAKAIGDYLDSPDTTSSIVYTLQFITYDDNRIIYFNGIGIDGNNSDQSICISTLTVQQC